MDDPELQRSSAWPRRAERRRAWRGGAWRGPSLDALIRHLFPAAPSRRSFAGCRSRKSESATVSPDGQGQGCAGRGFDTRCQPLFPSIILADTAADCSPTAAGRGGVALRGSSCPRGSRSRRCSAVAAASPGIHTRSAAPRRAPTRDPRQSRANSARSADNSNGAIPRRPPSPEPPAKLATTLHGSEPPNFSYRKSHKEPTTYPRR